MDSKIIDSSVYVSFFVPNDSNYQRAIEVFENLGNTKIFIPYHIYQETITVLHNKYMLELAEKFDRMIHADDRFTLLPPDIADEILFWREVNQQYRISYIDTAIVYASIKYDAELISFDKKMLQLYNAYIV